MYTYTYTFTYMYIHVCNCVCDTCVCLCFNNYVCNNIINFQGVIVKYYYYTSLYTRTCVKHVGAAPHIRNTKKVGAT